jgi:hypothetical protein
MKESDILYEIGKYWVTHCKTGHEVYKNGVTHSTRCAQIGFSDPEKSLSRAIDEANGRHDRDQTA